MGSVPHTFDPVGRSDDRIVDVAREGIQYVDMYPADAAPFEALVVVLWNALFRRCYFRILGRSDEDGIVKDFRELPLLGIFVDPLVDGAAISLAMPEQLCKAQGGKKQVPECVA